MKRCLTLVCFLTVVTLFSCKKENSAEKTSTLEMEDLKIPVGFTWENSTDIHFDISITDARFGSAIHVVSVYDNDPDMGGKLLSKGSASTSSHFLTKVYLPNTIKEVFVVKTAPDGSSSTQKVAISGAKLSVDLSATVKQQKNSATLGQGKVSGLDDGPDCNSGCTSSIFSSTSNLNVNAGQVVCIKGSNINVSFNMNGGTIRVCGTNVTMSGSLSNTSSLIITKGASVSFSSLNLNGSNATLKNYGTLYKTGALATSGTFVNEYYLVTTGDLNMNTGADFVNNGIILVQGTMNMNTGNTTTNNGAIITENHFQVNSTSTFINNCKLWVKGDFENNGTTKNYSYILVEDETSVNSNSDLEMYNASMLKTEDLTVNSNIQGFGTTSLVKITDRSQINSSGRIRNAIQYCDTKNGIEINNGQFVDGAVIACNAYIATDYCNTEGNGTAPPADTDGDGVNDSSDEYPNDATKAYNNYYPSSAPTSGATVAFEDQWPIKGDYDMNDVVVSYRYKIVTNSANKVVQVVGDYTLHATGGNYKNGFGVEFPITRSAVSGLTGGTLESGQTKAVVLLFSDMRSEMDKWNTRAGESETPVTYNVTFNVANGPTISSMGLGSYNPFIWNSGSANGRGYEIHLSGKTPTNKANTSLFGTGDDNSSTSAARYYETDTGLPWAIDIPVKPFKYPAEQKGILSGYLKFQNWAESGGSSFADWYSNTSTGYRNTANLF